MGLRTRLDSRSQGNNKIALIDGETKEILATIIATSENVALEIVTKADLYLEKPSGWCSKKGKKDLPDKK